MGASLSPVWHEWRDGGFKVWSRSISEVGICAATLARNRGSRGGRGPGGIEIRGVAELIADPEVVGGAAFRIADRYLVDAMGLNMPTRSRATTP